MARLVRWTALAAAAALLTAGCSGGSSDERRGRGGHKQRGALGGSHRPGMPVPLASQSLDWGRCKATADSPAPGGDWRCATLKVPLDWSDPDGETIGLALIRAKAKGDERLGSLLFNFGGPGGSGVSMMPSYADQRLRAARAVRPGELGPTRSGRQ